MRRKGCRKKERNKKKIRKIEGQMELESKKAQRSQLDEIRCKFSGWTNAVG